MRVLLQLLLLGISCCTIAADGKLAGLLQEKAGTFHISNERYPNHNHSPKSLIISGKAEMLKGNVGKYVELRGNYEIGDEEILFKAESVIVLAEEYYLEGQIVPYKHPDGSMAGIKYAIVTSSGAYYALSPSELKDELPLKNVRAYGQFKSAGHKGLLLAFYATRMEPVAIKELKE